VTLATLAELLESQAAIAGKLRDDPTNDRFLRLRLNYAAQISRFSALLGLCPRDRQNQPTTGESAELDPAAEMLRRISAARRVN
jgi:hypothetical protein